MLTVTDSAGEYIAQMLVEAHASDDTAIRLVFGGGALKSTMDNVRPGDMTFTYDDKTVLVLDAQIAEALTDATLDLQVVENGNAPQLVLMT